MYLMIFNKYVSIILSACFFMLLMLIISSITVVFFKGGSIPYIGLVFVVIFYFLSRMFYNYLRNDELEVNAENLLWNWLNLCWCWEWCEYGICWVEDWDIELLMIEKMIWIIEIVDWKLWICIEVMNYVKLFVFDGNELVV